jgi:hypothetical protein
MLNQSTFPTRRYTALRAFPAVLLPHGAAGISCHLPGIFGAVAPGGFSK